MLSLPPKGDTANKLGAYFAPLKTEAQSTPNMTVKVAEGSFWTAANEHMEYIGGTSPTISAPGSNAKWTLITITSTGMLNVVDGVSSGTPQLPDVSTYKNQLPLAAIFVGDTTTAITNDMIFDLRPLWKIPPDSVDQAQLANFATITYVDNGLNTKADTTGTASGNFTLNVGGSNINDSGIYVDRFSGPDVAIRFNETASIGSPPTITAGWEFTNDGVTWNPIGVASGSYYTKSDISAGALDFLYYTQNDLTNATPGAGVLDSRYYEQAAADALFTVFGHTHVPGDIIGLSDPVNTINGISPTLGDVQMGLDELNDVTISGTTTAAVIRYDGSVYRNTILLSDDLGDIAVTTPVVNDTLMYNGSVFLNRPLVKSDISDFLGTEFLLVTNVAGDAPAGDGPPDSNGTPQDIYGLKTFKDGVIIESSLLVSGSNTSIQTTELKVTDPYIDINFGETGTGVGGGTGVAGIRVDRGPLSGSPVTNKPAIIQWDEGTKQWEIGVEGNAQKILTAAHTHIHTQIDDWSSAFTTEMASNNLDNIKDVAYITAPATGEYLRYGVSDWENKSFATDVTAELNVNTLDQMQDVTYLGSPALVAGDFLQWTGTEWVNHTAVKADISDFIEADYIHTTGDEVKVGNLTINGDFTVGGGIGTVTTINSETVNILDSVITLNAGELGNGVDNGTGTAGIQVDRGGYTDAMMWWSEPAGTWLAHYSVTGGSPPSPSLVVGQLSFVGHEHVLTDITDVSVTATEVNSLSGIHLNSEIGPSATVSQQILDRITRRGDSMDSGANLTFSGAGEVLGLPATPSVNDAAVSKLYADTTFVDVAGDTMLAAANLTFNGGEVLGLPAIPTANDAASSKLYTDTEVARKIDRTGDAMDASANLSFSVGGEVLGLPVIPSATAATSKEYVDAHIADTVLHISTEQNTFLDGLTLTGSPALTSADVNQLIGISGNVQTLLDTKTDKLTPVVDQNLAALDIATGNIVDSGVVVNDASNTVNEIWTADKIDTTKADKIVPVLTNNLAGLDATGNLTDSGLILNDAGTLVSEVWSANQIDTAKVDKVPTAVVGNFGEFDAIGNLIDGGNNALTFAPAIHTHVSTDITDWTAAFTSELGLNSINAINDVNTGGAAVGDFLRWNGLVWLTTTSTNIGEFVHRTGSITESVTGVKTFSDDAFFQQDVTITQSLSVGGSATINGNLTVAGDQIIQGEEIVNTRDIVLNYGSTDPVSADSGGMILQRDTAGSPPSAIIPNAVVLWDHTTSKWQAGLDNALENVALENTSVAQPEYELQAGTGTAVYNLAFGVQQPTGIRTGIQVFVNGIKQIEGAGKAYQVNYSNISTTVVTFNVGSEPAVSADVEFYGFGFIG